MRKKDKGPQVKTVRPSIYMDILLTVHDRFLMELVGRICLNIKTFMLFHLTWEVS